MKSKVIILFILLCMLILLVFFLKNPFEKKDIEHPLKEEEHIEELRSFTYIITDIDENNYYGQSVDGKTKIYFNSEKVKYPIEDSLHVNDKILAYMEAENHIDGLIKIEKID